MAQQELLEKALNFIVETQESNDYICEKMIDMLPDDYCANNCTNLNKECVKLFLQNIYKKRKS